MCVLFTVFIFVHPRISNYLPWHYTQAQQHFLGEVLQKKTVDPQTYWEFREFYSLGNFTFDPKTVTFGETQIIYALPEDRNTLLTYTAPRMLSNDLIVKVDPSQPQAQSIKNIVSEYDKTYSTAEVVFKDDSTRIFKNPDGKYILLFAKTTDEMRSANGFFDYTGSEKKLLENTVWLNTTTFW